MDKQTELPDPFLIDESIRLWCQVRWGAYYLPEEYLNEFTNYWKEGKGKGKKKRNWNQAFRNWINSASPGGDKSDSRWEHKLFNAKKRDVRCPEGLRDHVLHICNSSRPDKPEDNGNNTRRIPPDSFSSLVTRLRSEAEGTKHDKGRKRTETISNEQEQKQRQEFIEKGMSMFEDLHDHENFPTRGIL